MLAFAELLAERTPAMLRFATVVTGSSHLAEGVVQDVLVKAHRRWDHIGGLDRSPVEVIDTPAADPADQVAQHAELIEAVRSLPRKAAGRRRAALLRRSARRGDRRDPRLQRLDGSIPDRPRARQAAHRGRFHRSRHPPGGSS